MDVDRAESSSCSGCSRAFTLTTRRHHCRACGKSFCDACSPYKIIIPWHEQAKQAKSRVCVECASPRILGCSSVPTSGGEVIIRGYMFGDSFSTPSVLVNGETCRGVRRLPSDGAGISNLRCSVPAGTGIGNSLKVSAKGPGGEILSGTGMFTYDPPVNLKAMSSLSTKGGWLVVTGQNLGPKISDVRVTCFDRQINEVELKQPHKRLRMRIPPGSGEQVHA
jgi:hypothetical protein